MINEYFPQNFRCQYAFYYYGVLLPCFVNQRPKQDIDGQIQIGLVTPELEDVGIGRDNSSDPKSPKLNRRKSLFSSFLETEANNLEERN